MAQNLVGVLTLELGIAQIEFGGTSLLRGPQNTLNNCAFYRIPAKLLFALLKLLSESNIFQ
jgi:hypothetical protein